MVNRLAKRFLLKIIFTISVLAFISPNEVEGFKKRIFHGRNAAHSDFKYHVSIQRDDEHLCGGAIITNQFVLTAAHCFVVNGSMTVSKSHLTVLHGTNSLLFRSGLTNEVEKITVLRDYVNIYSHKLNNYMDIAVVKLKNKLFLDGLYRKAINLPEEYSTSPSEGETVTVAGYGLTEKANIYLDDNGVVQVDGNYSNILKTIQPVVVDTTNCRMTEKHICTYVPRYEDDQHYYGECYGDSGSPLVYNNTVVGVLSAGGPVCGDPYSPTIYTRVSFYLKFIHDALNELNTNQMVTYKKSQQTGYYY